MGYPGVAIRSHYPVPVAGIRLKVVVRIRNPYISMYGIINPVTIGQEFIIKNLERYSRLDGLRFRCFDKPQA